MQPGKIIFLNGTSSSGKTTIGKRLQEKLPEPYLLYSVDDLLNCLPGWVFEPTTQEDADKSNQIIYNLISNFHRVVGTLARAGTNLIVDHVLQEEVWLTECLKEWHGLEVCFVGVKCPLDELEKREKERGNRNPGTAAYQFDRVHAHNMYDIEVDTSIFSSDECAERIKHAAEEKDLPTAFEKLYEHSFPPIV
jgi:chloramphenicol 3-O phosphotransferase